MKSTRTVEMVVAAVVVVVWPNDGAGPLAAQIASVRTATGLNLDIKAGIHAPHKTIQVIGQLPPNACAT